MGTRREARELALQALYQLDVGGEGDAEPTLFWSHFDAEEDVAAFARELVDGVAQNRERIDALIAASADEEVPKLGRAFVAAALGGVGDKDPLPWHLPLSVDANYSSPVDTLTNGATGILDIL